MSARDVLGNECIRSLYDAVVEELRRVGDNSFPMYVSENGFMAFTELPGGMAFRLKGTCSEDEDERIPRLYGEIYGLVSLVRSIGGDRRLAEFLLRLLTVPSNSFLSVSLGDQEEVIVEVYLPFTGVFLKTLREAAEKRGSFTKLYADITVFYVAAFLNWVLFNLDRIASDASPMDFDLEKLKKTLDMLLRREEAESRVSLFR